ncbi:MAG: hypothetical protein ACTHJK_11065 [Sphingomicrobium sp.]
MESSTTLPPNIEETGKHRRGAGRGSNFMLLHRPAWATICEAKNTNRMNLATAFLVLLAGTGADHRLTKWSAKACEEYAGMGKPRAKQAIEELIGLGLLERTDTATTLMPQYRLPEVPREDEPIYLPKQIITGLGGATPLIRRLREVGDFFALRMLIDLYGLVETDATHAVSIHYLRECSPEEGGTKVSEAGVNAIWAMPVASGMGASGDWAVAHRTKDKDPWAAFWERVHLLKKIGAIWFEPWVFEGTALDAEPLFPVDPTVLYGVPAKDKAAELTQLMQEASHLFVGERDYLLERHYGEILIPLPLHHQPPAIRGVARMMVEADTPGCRMAFGKRMSVIERATKALQLLVQDMSEGTFNRPVQYLRPMEAE